MRTPRALLLLPASLLLGGVILLLGDAPEIDSSAAARREAAQESAQPIDGSTRAVDHRTDARRATPTPTPLPASDAVMEPTSSEAGDEPMAPVASGDLHATQSLELRVVDEFGGPVMDAEVRILGHRTAAMPGSWIGYRGNPPVARTDFDGRATLEHFAWVTIDGRVSAIDLEVEHPDFVFMRDDLFPVGEGLHTVTLERGATVALTAWVGEPGRVVETLEIRADWDSGVAADDWVREASGRHTTTRFGPGEHALRVVCERPEGGRYFSERIEFTLEPGGYVDLSVELFAGSRLEGRLDPRVPRPIVDGLVLVSIHQLELSGGPTLADERQVSIDADGEFAVEDLPPGEGQLFALCRGWVSQPALLEQSLRLTLDGETPFEDVRDMLVEGPPRIEVPSLDPIVVAMQPTGSVLVRVVDENGAAIPDASVGVSPNVVLLGVGSSIVPGRNWSARVGVDGRARIDDLPPTAGLFVHARAPGHRPREADRLQIPSLPVRSGETSAIELVLERDADTGQGG